MNNAFLSTFQPLILSIFFFVSIVLFRYRLHIFYSIIFFFVFVTVTFRRQKNGEEHTQSIGTR